MKRLASTIAAVAITATAASALVAAPASAKAVSFAPMTCSAGSAASAIIQKQGAQFQLGFSTNAPGRWHVVITDGPTSTLTDYTSPSPTGGLNLITFAKLPKGVHFIGVAGTNLTTGESCTTTIGAKV